MGESKTVADDATDIKPWTIKNVPPEERNAAIAAAQREGLSIGQWLARAIRSQVQVDRNQDRAPAVTAQHVVRHEGINDDTLAQLERLLTTAKMVAGDGQIPRSIRRPANKLLLEQLGGLLPRPNGAAPPQ